MRLAQGVSPRRELFPGFFLRSDFAHDPDISPRCGVCGEVTRVGRKSPSYGVCVR